MVKDLLFAVKQEIVRLSIWVGLAIAFMPLWIVPFVGTVLYSAVMTFISIRYLAWDGLDYCMGRRRWRVRRKMAFLKEWRARTVGYGTVSFVLLAIPFTTLFVLPLNSLGGSILFCKILNETDSSQGAQDDGEKSDSQE